MVLVWGSGFQSSEFTVSGLFAVGLRRLRAQGCGFRNAALRCDFPERVRGFR